MKKVCCGLFALVWIGTGCLTSVPIDWPGNKPVPVPAPAAGRAEKPSVPVIADQVTEKNAHEKAEELDREMQDQTKSQ